MEDVKTTGQVVTICDMCLVEEAISECPVCDADMCKACAADDLGRCEHCFAQMVECIGCGERFEPGEMTEVKGGVGEAGPVCENCIRDVHLAECMDPDGPGG